MKYMLKPRESMLYNERVISGGEGAVDNWGQTTKAAQFQSYAFFWVFGVLSRIGGAERTVKLCIKVQRNDVGGFTATCPSLPGCVSAGQTTQQAKENLEEAIRGYLASVNNFVPAHLHEMLVYQS